MRDIRPPQQPGTRPLALDELADVIDTLVTGFPIGATGSLAESRRIARVIVDVAISAYGESDRIAPRTSPRRNVTT